MSDDAPRWASFSSAFSIVLSLASDRIAELGCDLVGDDPKTFVDRGGLRRLEMEAADAAIRRVREAAYPLIFKLVVRLGNASRQTAQTRSEATESRLEPY